jgi:sarcosine oxidase, subunit beta
MNSYDVIIAGAGSLGVPTALALGRAGARVLVVDAKPSPGQGENKHAIGGIRATHSTPGKILCGLRSLEIFSTWQAEYGDDIEWLQGGYLFPVYRKAEETALKGILPIQKKHGLDIDFVGPEEVAAQIPGIVMRELIGGTFSPKDGSASPLLAINAFYRKALEKGVTFRFKEKIHEITTQNGRVTGIETDLGKIEAPVVVDAAGAYSRPLGKTAGIDIPVIPDSHEGAITEPVQPFFKCMVVDLRPGDGSKNYYFYQNLHGQVVFCITPDPPIIGTDHRETSVFLPQVCKRMVGLVPRLKNIRVRRVWRGLYPMSPDGAPLVGWNRSLAGLFHITGMCGQGYMLGPGIGEVAARAITGSSLADDDVILKEFSPDRQFGGEEALK